MFFTVYILCGIIIRAEYRLPIYICHLPILRLLIYTLWDDIMGRLPSSHIYLSSAHSPFSYIYFVGWYYGQITVFPYIFIIFSFSVFLYIHCGMILRAEYRLPIYIYVSYAHSPSFYIYFIVWYYRQNTVFPYLCVIFPNTYAKP